MEDLQALLDALTAEGADQAAILAGLPGADLDALLGACLAEFDRLRPEAERDDEALSELETIADTHALLSEEAGRRDTASAERMSRINELSSRFGTEGDEPEGGEGNGDGDGGDGDTPPPDGGGDPAVETTTTTTTPVVPASSSNGGGTALATRPVRPALSRASRGQSRPNLPGPRTTGPSIRAAADVPGIPVGREISMGELARAVDTRFGSIPTGITASYKFGLAAIERYFPPDLRVTNDSDATEVMNHAADHARLPGGSLLAAGGWCAPSETLYDIPTFATATGLISTPEISVSRGGLRWAGSPDFSAIYANTGFTMTEAQNIAGFTKPCYEIPCPGFTEARLDAMGLCLTAGILQTKGYPEQIEAFMKDALIAHTHQVNAEKIKRMAALATPVTAGARRLGPIIDALDWLELEVEDIRYKYRLDPHAPVEAVIPLWLRPVLRTDLQRRWAVTGSNADVSDSALQAYFVQRSVNPQWVYDWQDALVNAPTASDAGLFGGATPISDYPASVDILIYPAGAYIVANDPIITLEGIYDSVNIRTNTYTALFTEESILVALRNLEARKVTLAIDRRLPTA